MIDGGDRGVLGRPGSNASNRQIAGAPQPSNLADLLERVLDKGIVIAGDITLCLGTVEVLTLRIRLLIASVDKAQEIGINWWQSDPALSSRAKALEEDRDRLQQRLDRLEGRLARQSSGAVQEQPGEPKSATRRSPRRRRAAPGPPPTA